jgi:TRAP-type C4-dicarboxylate transport system, large permease component
MMWVEALITGADKIAWVICLTLVGSIYAESQKRIGTMETVLNACRARFGHSPKGLVCVIMFTLCLSGSLLGESVASAVVIGALIIGNLDELGMTPEQTTATIVMGCALGSIMPPISQASTMAAGLVDANSDAVLNWTYVTIGIIFILCCIYVLYLIY